MRARLVAAIGSTMFAALVATSSQAEMLTLEEFIGKSIGQQIGDTVVKGAQFKSSKHDANAEFAQARRAFYAQLANGILGSPEEQNFAELLYDKDIYYLSLNVSEGVRSSAKRMKALDALSGGAALDDGIAGWPADDLFDVWVTDVRSQLGATADGQLIFVFDPVAFKQAIDATKPSYDRYRKARDEQEFKRWRASRPLIMEPKADTPEQRADTYMRVVMHNAVEEVVENLPQKEREQFRAKTEPWASQVRQAIIDYEKRAITPDTVSRAMKAWKYSDEETAYFWSWLGGGKNLQGNDFVAAVDKALAATQKYRDLKQYGKQFDTLPTTMDAALKAWLQKEESPGDKNTLDYLQQHKPIAFKLIPYLMVADLISTGHLGQEPPLPAFRRFGDPVPATSAAASPAPAARPAEANPEKKVTSLSGPEPGGSPGPKPVPKPRGSPQFEAGVKKLSLGIKLGDMLDAADEKVRASTKLAAVIDNDPNANGYGPAFLTGRVYVVEGYHGRIALLWVRTDPKKRIVSLSRLADMPNPPISEEKAMKILTDQLGPADEQYISSAIWYGGTTAKPDTTCTAVSNGSHLGRGFVVSEGTLPDDANAQEEPADVNAWETISFLDAFLYPDGSSNFTVKCHRIVWSNYDSHSDHPSQFFGTTDGSLAADIWIELSGTPPQANLRDTKSGQN